MTSIKLRLTGRQYQQLKQHLLPGDGLEAVALTLCGVARSSHDGKDFLSISVHKIHPISYGEGPYLWSAVFQCPCGCRALIELSLHREGRPRWTLNEHADKTVTLSPSVWRTVGCKSHFFFEKSRIRWVKS
jgi:hypothetical protein